jgi:hypothetical protein
MDSRSTFLPHLVDVTTKGRRRRIEKSGDGRPDESVQAGSRREIHWVTNGETGSEANGRKVLDSTLPGKPPQQSPRCPYLKPTQVGEGEYPQALERTLAQELGKLTP